MCGHAAGPTERFPIESELTMRSNLFQTRPKSFWRRHLSKKYVWMFENKNCIVQKIIKLAFFTHLHIIQKKKKKCWSIDTKPLSASFQEGREWDQNETEMLNVSACLPCFMLPRIKNCSRNEILVIWKLNLHKLCYKLSLELMLDWSCKKITVLRMIIGKQDKILWWKGRGSE